ncbi:MAG: AAA family ATPase [Acholeplasmataceae bacterium]|nr:AAA family ATPase [Acholeplasmataceae bacterium]
MLVFVGASASGKTELAKTLFKTFGYKKCLTTTTRPKRNGEQDGVDYHFVNLLKFQQLEKERAFLEINEYNHYWYGTQKTDIFDHGIIIVDPNGANALLEALGADVFVVFVEASKETRKKRMNHRQDEQAIIEKRLAKDESIFRPEKIKRIDLIIHNENEDLEHLANQIHQVYQKQRLNR